MWPLLRSRSTTTSLWLSSLLLLSRIGRQRAPLLCLGFHQNHAPATTTATMMARHRDAVFPQTVTKERCRYPSHLFVAVNGDSDSDNLMESEEEERTSVRSQKQSPSKIRRPHQKIWFETADGGQSNTDMLRNTLRQLARLSLEDYEWRSGIFKSNEADRMVEESIARMRGEDPTYVRPMDAPEDGIGPLGRWERSAVQWLSGVMEEEGRRAQKIVNLDGMMVRPIEAITVDGKLGPLGMIEKAVVDFLQSIRSSERERLRTNTLRPKDLQGVDKGPLGRMEEEAVRILDEISKSEILRAEMRKSRPDGGIIRPIDVPGPLGEFEMKVSELFQAEQLRSKERDRNDGQIVRPKDAKVRGPLGEAELQAYETIKQLNLEEMERLRNIQRALEEKRPMDVDESSFWGVVERFLVGITRAPQMLLSVIGRVKELLLDAEALPKNDRKVLDASAADAPVPNKRQDSTTSNPPSSAGDEETDYGPFG